MTFSRGCQLYFDFHQKNFDAKKMEITLAYIQAVIYYYLLVYTVSIFNYTRYLEQTKNYSDFCLVLSLALLVYYCDRTAV